MTTEIGIYLDKLKINKAKLSRLSGITTNRLNAISKSEEAKPYGDEFYKIVFIANKLASLEFDSFNKAVNEIYPNRLKTNLLAGYEGLSPEARFFKKYTQQQKDIEEKLGIPNGKISKYTADKNKRALASEIIAFADGMQIDIFETFNEIYGDLNVEIDFKSQ